MSGQDNSDLMTASSLAACGQNMGAVQIRPHARIFQRCCSVPVGQGLLFSSQPLTTISGPPGMFRPLHMQRHVLQPRASL
jgi:hypothetical protein